MFEFFHFANLARKGLIKFKEGKIIITSLRVLLFDVESLSALERELETIFGYNGLAHFLYRMSVRGGSRAAKAHQKFSKYEGDDLVKYMATMATGAGWGKLQVTKLSPVIEITVQDSPFAKRNRNLPTCHYLRGFIAGAVSYIRKSRHDCIEINCKSVGQKKCTFIIAKRSELEKNKEHKKYLKQIAEFDFDF